MLYGRATPRCPTPQLPFLAEKIPRFVSWFLTGTLSNSYLRKLHPLSTPLEWIFYIPEAWNKYPFRAEHPGIGRCREYPNPLPLRGGGGEGGSESTLFDWRGVKIYVVINPNKYSFTIMQLSFVFPGRFNWHFLDFVGFALGVRGIIQWVYSTKDMWALFWKVFVLGSI